MSGTWILLSATAAFGVASSLHCAAMCGPLVGCWASGRGASAPYHIARVLSYATMGALVGSVGTLVPRALGETMGRVLPATAALFFVLHIVGILPKISRIPVAGDFAAHLARRAAGLSTPGRALLLGLLTPLLPCATLAGMLALTLAAGTAGTGALVMGVFAATTAPALFASQLGAAAARAWLSVPLLKSGRQVLVMASTLLVVVRAVLATRGQACH